MRRILIDSAGNVWAGTNQGLGLFDRINGTFQNYRHDGKDDRSLAGDNIGGLAEMSDHTLWVSSDLGGISILDLGLNEFRLDLLEYAKTHPDLDKTPFGLHAIARASKDAPAGVIYVLKNRSGSVNINNQNRLHPFYMVYLTNEGEVVCDHLSPKNMLDKMRYLCKGKTDPIAELYHAFNRETRDGRDMRELSRLLGDAIASIIEVKEESDIDSFLSGGQVSFLADEIKGLDDFELICFLVIR